MSSVDEGVGGVGLQLIASVVRSSARSAVSAVCVDDRLVSGEWVSAVIRACRSGVFGALEPDVPRPGFVERCGDRVGPLLHRQYGPAGQQGSESWVMPVPKTCRGGMWSSPLRSGQGGHGKGRR